MAESPDHELQMELNVGQEQSQGDVSDDTSVYSDTHSARGIWKLLLIDQGMYDQTMTLSQVKNLIDYI